ncbi:uncharacterized protein [Sinocyclocheilus grahami]|uniref:uncharacterized protein n=1 Tax=Sinocyclocheilus grahami TaxID=75366 RepID=UPI0007ACF0DA|nr:PREDICTED: uncharacterized protein LOC107561255 [Sinocyclocheilus grahami]
MLLHSSGNEPVCFEEMTLGLDKVRRLSTQSSVLLPGFTLTTCWCWYWKNEYHRWIQYGSIAEMHRMSSVSIEQLELRYQEYLQQEQEDAGIKFSAGNCFYELRFADMKQRNEVSGTERAVRRRPVFVSSVGVRIARTRCCGASKTHFSKGVPGFWDQNAIPDFGFQRVRLWPSHRDYVRVHERFSQTLRGFTVRRIERVQNRELWEDFMLKKERMKTTNKQEKFGDRLLFHATESSLVEAACLRNVDFETSDTAAYGQGIYLSKDARYWIEREDGCATRLMFACRVLVGYYTRGAARFRHPPAKNTDGSLYDSCVDNPRDPSVFVVFDRCQIYPEFLITFEESNKCLVSGIARVDTKESSRTAEATEPERASVISTNSSGCTSLDSSLEGPDSDPEHTSSSSRRTEPLITLLSSTLDTDVGVSAALPVSTKSATNALPVSTERISTVLPVSEKRNSTALPVSPEDIYNAFPLSAKGISSALPVSTERISTARPVSEKRISSAFPVSAKSVSTAFPVSPEDISNAFPLSAKGISPALPVSSGSASNALPVATNRFSPALPVSSGSASNALPVATNRFSPALPVSSGSASNALPVATNRFSPALPVSSGSASNALPVATNRFSPALPVSSGSASNALPVATNRFSPALPVSSGSASNALPVATNRFSPALPVSSGSASNALPVATNRFSPALPVSSGSASNALPVATNRFSPALPVSSGSASNALPVATNRFSPALPVSSGSASNALPVATNRFSPALPVSSGSASNALPVSYGSTSVTSRKPAAQKNSCTVM